MEKELKMLQLLHIVSINTEKKIDRPLKLIE